METLYEICHLVVGNKNVNDMINHCSHICGLSFKLLLLASINLKLDDLFFISSDTAQRNSVSLGHDDINMVLIKCRSQLN